MKHNILGIRGIYVAPAKSVSDKQTDDGLCDPFVALCITLATKNNISIDGKV